MEMKAHIVPVDKQIMLLHFVNCLYCFSIP